MKRFHAREMILVSAPLLIIGAGAWFVTARTLQPRIVAARLRPATSFELSQGAQFGVAIEADAPSEPFSCPGLRWKLNKSADAPSVVGYNARSEYRGDYYRLQENFGIRWPQATLSKPLAQLDVSLNIGCGPHKSSSKTFSLDETNCPARILTLILLPIPASRKLKYSSTAAHELKISST
jgi:hypothetical protein